MGARSQSLFNRTVGRGLAIGTGLLAMADPGRAQVITETFKNATAPGWVFAGTGYTPTLTSGTAGPDGNTAGDGWLRLTTPNTNQATSAYYNTAFTAANATWALKVAP